MARRKRETKGKKINPTFFVFCEGESEEAYVRHLRTTKRVPVEIVSKITRNQISARKIRESIKNSPTHEKDKVYLMYDIDVKDFLQKLKSIQSQIQKQIHTELIVSNPCFELWYIYHICSHTAEISSENCIKKLQTLCLNYKKGYLPVNLNLKLEKHKCDAIKRSKNQKPFENPSTLLYLLLEELEKIDK